MPCASDKAALSGEAKRKKRGGGAAAQQPESPRDSRLGEASLLPKARDTNTAEGTRSYCVMTMAAWCTIHAKPLGRAACNEVRPSRLG
jgi:hypothetical protein